MGRPLSREGGLAVYSAITQWSESRRTRNHTLLSHLRPLQPGRPCSRVVIPPHTGFPLLRVLRLTELRWRYSSPPPHGDLIYNFGLRTNITLLGPQRTGNIFFHATQLKPCLSKPAKLSMLGTAATKPPVILMFIAVRQGSPHS
jgi:hypothetical protein